MVKSKRITVFVLLALGVLAGRPIDGHWKIPASVKEWRYLDTTHFRIHYPAGYEEMASHAALYAEEASARLEIVLRHRIKRVIPVFLYAGHQDFAATNILPFEIDEGTGGFTDFYRRRVVVPFTGSYAQLRHVLTHEIVHAYQFDILTGDEAEFPLWLVEGMAEYLSLGWDESAETHIKDAVLHNRMPSVVELQMGMVNSGYMYYKAGQAVMLFIASRWGPERIGYFLKELKAVRRFDYAFESTFDMRPEAFDIAFGQFMRARYAKMMPSVSVGPDPRIRNVTWRYHDLTGFNVHPVISPDGKKIAYITVDLLFPVIVIRPMPGPGVTVKEADTVKIVVKALRSGSWEEWQPLTTRLSFSPDGRTLVLAGRRFGRQSLLLVDVQKEEMKGGFDLPFDAIQYPSLSGDGKSAVFTGVVRGKADVFLFEFASQQLTRLTDDWSYETNPRLSPDGRMVYFSSDKDPSRPQRIDRPQRRIFRVDLAAKTPVVLTNVGGNADNPMPSRDGSLIISSDFTGVPNLYRIRSAADRRKPAGESDLLALTESATGVFQPSLALSKEKGETLAFSEIQEGAYEIKILPPGILKDGRTAADLMSISDADVLNPAFRTFDPERFHYPTAAFPLLQPFLIDHFSTAYKPTLRVEGRPFLFITGAADSKGRTALAALVFAALADDTGDHRMLTFVEYSTGALNADVQYAYLKYRLDFFMGFYSHSGVSAILNFVDFSLNNVLYNPYFRLFTQQSTGAYFGLEYPIHRYGALSATLGLGRDEKVYDQTAPESRIQKDVFKNQESLTFSYTFDNSAYTMYGPLDGHALLFSYSVPLKPTGTERDLYASIAEFRFYHLFSNFSNFAFRAFAGAVSGNDADLYPFQVGGFYSIRGYRYLEFQGTKAFLLNFEYRFNFIEYLQFGVPTSWSLGLIRGVMFFDAGSAFDDIRQYRAYDGRFGVTRDLHLSFGLGIHWVNFMRYIFPGAIMKIDWATPYDTKRSLPLSKWRGEFSLGFNF